MEYLKKIYNKKDTLLIKKIRLLYELDNKIHGFYYQNDQKLAEMEQELNQKGYKKYLSEIFNCKEDGISQKKEDILFGQEIIYFYGSLFLNYLSSPKGITLPKYLGRSLELNEIESGEYLTLPEIIADYLELEGLSNATGLTFPKYIGGSLYLRGLTDTDDLNLPNYIGGDLDLSNLESAQCLTLPKYIGGDLDLCSLVNTNILLLPEYIGGSLLINSRLNQEDIVFPENFVIENGIYSASLNKKRVLAKYKKVKF